MTWHVTRMGPPAAIPPCDINAGVIRMNAFTISAISAALLAASSIAGATPVEVAAGSSLTRNFDLGAMGANPAPTYSKLWMDFGIVKSTVFNDGQIDYGDVYVY